MTAEYEELLGTAGLRQFTRLFALGFLALRARADELVGLVSVMQQRATLDCFEYAAKGERQRRRQLWELQQRLFLHENQELALAAAAGSAAAAADGGGGGAGAGRKIGGAAAAEAAPAAEAAVAAAAPGEGAAAAGAAGGGDLQKPVQWAVQLVQASLRSWKTRQYDEFQQYSNGILP
jgi:hypothetical protein